jgi:hypothetical protein
MFDAIKPLLDSGIINEDTRTAISEAWEAKLHEARESIRAELREEFAGRYEHDKGMMVEALDKMVTESLSAEIKEFAEDKQKLAEDRVKFKRHMSESASKFDNFLVTKLAEEIKELRADRKTYENNISQLEKFVMKSLAEEISEFETDKKSVIEAKVRLVAEAQQQHDKLRKQFVERSAKLVKESVGTKLESELTQLKEDIQIARENNFGRRLFEAFASEFAVTHLNENREIAKLQDIVQHKNKQLKEAVQIAETTKALVETKNKEIKIVKESVARKETMDALLKTLNKEKATIMSQLLENVQTDKLQNAYEKYLPAVLNNGTMKTGKTVISESRSEVTGDKTAKTQTAEPSDNVIEIKRLAGLK